MQFRIGNFQRKEPILSVQITIWWRLFEVINHLWKVSKAGNPSLLSFHAQIMEAAAINHAFCIF